MVVMVVIVVEVMVVVLLMMMMIMVEGECRIGKGKEEIVKDRERLKQIGRRRHEQPSKKEAEERKRKTRAE